MVIDELVVAGRREGGGGLGGSSWAPGAGAGEGSDAGGGRFGPLPLLLVPLFRDGPHRGDEVVVVRSVLVRQIEPRRNVTGLDHLLR